MSSKVSKAYMSSLTMFFSLYAPKLNSFPAKVRNVSISFNKTTLKIAHMVRFFYCNTHTILIFMSMYVTLVISVKVHLRQHKNNICYTSEHCINLTFKSIGVFSLLIFKNSFPRMVSLSCGCARGDTGKKIRF